MNRLTIIALLAFAPVASSQDRLVTFPIGQTITGDELRAAGVTRLSNLFVLFDGVRFTTVDGFTTTPSFNGLAALQERVWRVEIDAHPVYDGVLDVQSLNTLAVPITSIDRIVVKDVPHVHQGRFERGGVIEIWTKGGREEGFVRSAISVGNETGDPGPYRYANPELRAANVDKEGPDIAIEGGFTRSRASAHVGLVMNQIIPSDPAVFSRILSVFDDSQTPVMRVVAPFAGVKAALPRGDVSVRMSAALFDDMLFSRNVGREIPAEYRRIGVTAVANTAANGVNVQWTFGAAKRVVRNYASATRIPFHWDEQNATASVSGIGPALGGMTTAGLSVEYAGARSELGLEDRANIVTRRVHVGYERLVGSATTSFDLFAAADGSARSAGFTAAGEVPIWVSQQLGANLSVAQILPSESNVLAYWSYRGLDLTPDQVTTYPGLERPPKLASADLHWTWRPAGTRSLQVAVTGRRFAGLRLSHRVVMPDDDDGFQLESQSYDSAWGSTIGIRIRGDVEQGRSRYSLAWSYQTVLDGNATFYDAFDDVSRRQIRITSVHRIAERFSISNTIYHYSSSSWEEFEAVEETSRYSSVVPGFVRWDVALYKGLADDKLQLTFAFENLLNDRVGYHPVGATFDRALRVQLAVVLD